MVEALRHTRTQRPINQSTNKNLQAIDDNQKIRKIIKNKRHFQIAKFYLSKISSFIQKELFRLNKENPPLKKKRTSSIELEKLE